MSNHPLMNKAASAGTGTRKASVGAASEVVAGVLELATQAETDAGTNDSAAVTPLKLLNYAGTLNNVTSVDGVDPSAVAAQVTALGAENTDAQFWLGHASFEGQSGTWTRVDGVNNVGALRRTAAAGVTTATVDISQVARSAASKGLKITSYKVVYSVDTADVDDVLAILVKTAVPADNAAAAAYTQIAGAVDGDYDADHDTAAERGDDTSAPEHHTATVTVGSPAYIADGEIWSLAFQVDGDAGPSGIVDLYGVMVYASETRVDLS